MRNIVLLLAAIVLATPAAAAPIDWSSIDRHYARSEACSDPGRPRRPAGAQGARSEAWAAAFLGWMLRVDRTRCPGLAAAAAIEIEIIVDPPERADVPLAFLDLAWRSAAEGLGRVRNPTEADRYGRILWLLANEPPVWPEFTEPMQRQWLSRPEQIALLEAFLARSASGNARQARMLAELRSRRDLPGYDPRRAAELFGRAGDRARQAELMTGMAPAPSDAPAIAAAPVSQPPPRAAPAEPAPRVAPAQPQSPAPAQLASREAPPPVPSVQQPQREPPSLPVPPVQQAQREAPAPPPSRAPAPPPPRAAPIQQARRDVPPPPRVAAPAPQAPREDPPSSRREAPVQQTQRESAAQREAPALAMRESPAQPAPREAPFRATPLQLGQRAAESAQTDQERLDALRTLFAAALAGGSEGCTALAAQLGRIRPSTFASLTREDLGRIERALGSESIGITLNPGGRALRPVLTRGLIDSGGRLVMAQMVSSSGSTAADQAVMAGWLRLAGRLTLSARPRGAAWVPLPPSFPTSDVATEPAARSLCL